MPEHPIQNDSPSARAERQIRMWIQRGDLQAGDQLLPEEELAQQLGVARTTIRSVLGKLEQAGLIQLKGRKRTVLAPGRQQGGAIRHAIVMLCDPPSPVSASTGRLPGWAHQIHDGVAAAAQNHGKMLMYLPEKLVRTQIEGILAERPAGVIGLSDCGYLPDQAVADELLRSGIPTAFYGDHSMPALERFACVYSDHAAGQGMVVRQLHAAGRRSVRRCWYEQSGKPVGWVLERDRGYAEACAAAGVPVLPTIAIAQEHLGPQGVDEAAFRRRVRLVAGCLAEQVLGSDPPDALLAMSDGLVPYLAAALRILGRDGERAPVIAGYDHYWGEIVERRWESTPPVLSIDKRNAAMGARLVDLVVAGRPDAAVHLVEPRLVMADEIRAGGI